MICNLESNPRLFWGICLAGLPLWGILAIGVLYWIIGASMPQRAIEMPNHDNQLDNLALSQSRSLEDYRVIWSRSLRQELLQKKKAPRPMAQVQERSLDFSLLGTAMEGEQSYALFRSRQGLISIAKVGSPIHSFTVQSIQPAQVSLVRDGVVSYLELPESMRKLLPTNSSQLAVTVKSDQNRIGPFLDHPNVQQESGEVATLRLDDVTSQQFMRDVRLVPSYAALGRQRGYRIDSIAASSPVTVSGLQPGDVILSVDDAELTTLTDVGTIYASLASLRSHRWQVQRDNLILSVELNFKEDTASATN